MVKNCALYVFWLKGLIDYIEKEVDARESLSLWKFRPCV